MHNALLPCRAIGVSISLDAPQLSKVVMDAFLAAINLSEQRPHKGDSALVVITVSYDCAPISLCVLDVLA